MCRLDLGSKAQGYSRQRYNHEQQPIQLPLCQPCWWSRYWLWLWLFVHTKSTIRNWCNLVGIHCERKRTHQNFLSQTPVDTDKIWYTLSWMNLRYSLNVFQLIWIMSLHYLVKLSVHILWTAIETVNPKTHQMFLSHRLNTRPILIRFCTYYPE